MKVVFLILFSFLIINTRAQKYMLLDKTMSFPATLANAVTIKDEYRNFFAIERSRVSEFVAQLEKIAKEITSGKIPESFNFYVGATRFYGLKIPLKKEERMDVVLTTDCNGQKISMHLCDGKVSNSSNAFYIKTWAEYIQNNAKVLK